MWQFTGWMVPMLLARGCAVFVCFMSESAAYTINQSHAWIYVCIWHINVTNRWLLRCSQSFYRLPRHLTLCLRCVLCKDQVEHHLTQITCTNTSLAFDSLQQLSVNMNLCLGTRNILTISVWAPVNKCYCVQFTRAFFSAQNLYGVVLEFHVFVWKWHHLTQCVRSVWWPFCLITQPVRTTISNGRLLKFRQLRPRNSTNIHDYLFPAK